MHCGVTDKYLPALRWFEVVGSAAGPTARWMPWLPRSCLPRCIGGSRPGSHGQSEAFAVRGDFPAKGSKGSKVPRMLAALGRMRAHLGLRDFDSCSQGLGVRCEDDAALHLPIAGPWAPGAKEAVTHSPISRAHAGPSIRCAARLISRGPQGLAGLGRSRASAGSMAGEFASYRALGGPTVRYRWECLLCCSSTRWHLRLPRAYACHQSDVPNGSAPFASKRSKISPGPRTVRTA